MVGEGSECSPKYKATIQIVIIGGSLKIRQSTSSQQIENLFLI